MAATTYIDIPYKTGPPPTVHASAFSYKPRRSLWRMWMRTSRFQRYCLLLSALAVGVVFYMYHAKEIKISSGPGLPSNEAEALVRPDLPISNDILPAPNIEPVAQADHPHQENHQPSYADEPATIKAKREAIRSACRHAWRGYKRYAWGHDHLLPVSKRYDNWFGLGLTIIDSLDTLYIMGLKEEFEEAKEYVKNDLNFDKNKDVNLFETTIRVLGGLLGAFTLTQDTLFLEKAKDIGDRLMAGFNSRSMIPFSDVNIGTGTSHGPHWAKDSTVSEVSSIQLEFRTLSRLLENPKYEEKSFFVSKHIHEQPKYKNLVPMFISTETGRFGGDQTITLGARADSYYEYLLKQWIQTGKTIEWLKDDYVAAIESVWTNLVKYSQPNRLLFVGELKNRNFSPKMDHLVCYLPGTLALGHFLGGMPKSHMTLAEGLINTCVKMYTTTSTGLSPEIAYFNMANEKDNDIIIKSNDAHNLLRPETVESLWYMFYFTRNETYRNWAWDIFNAFETHTKIATGGYTSIGNVQSNLFPRPRDKMESFFLGETLKYFYLLFAPPDQFEKYSPRNFVYNTEAHPLPIYEK